MVTFRATADVGRPAEEVFGVYGDVTRWPEWTDSFTEVQRLDSGPLRHGSRARVRQPRLPQTEWTVTSFRADHSFSWETRGPGVHTIARHLVEPIPDGARVTAEVEQRGPVGLIVGLLTARLTRRYLDMEVKGLRDFCEQRP